MRFSFRPKTSSGRQEFWSLIKDFSPSFLPVVILGAISFFSKPQLPNAKIGYAVCLILYVLLIIYKFRGKVLLKERTNDVPFTIHVVNTEDNAELKLFHSKFSNDILSYLESNKKLNLYIFKRISEYLPGVVFWSFNRTKIGIKANPCKDSKNKEDVSAEIKREWIEALDDLSEEWNFFYNQASFAASLHVLSHNRKVVYHNFQDCPVFLSFYFGYIIGKTDLDLCLYNYGTVENEEEKYFKVVDTQDIDLSNFGKLSKEKEIEEFLSGVKEEQIVDNNIYLRRYNTNKQTNEPISITVFVHYKEGLQIGKSDFVIERKLEKANKKIEVELIQIVYTSLVKIAQHFSDSEVHVSLFTLNSVATALGFAFERKDKPENISFNVSKDLCFKLSEIKQIAKII